MSQEKKSFFSCCCGEEDKKTETIIDHKDKEPVPYVPPPPQPVIDNSGLKPSVRFTYKSPVTSSIQPNSSLYQVGGELESKVQRYK